MKNKLILLILLMGISLGYGQTIVHDSKVQINITDASGGADEILAIDGNGVVTNTGVLVSGLGGSPTGFEALNEGSGIGWRLIGRDATKYGDIGLEAIDGSLSITNSITLGATGQGAFIGGGKHNTASNQHSTVGGGISNDNSGYQAFIGGGAGNLNSSAGGVIVGGGQNIASGTNYAAVVGGQGNEAGESYSFVGAGQNNKTEGTFSTIPGGFNCTAFSYGEFVIGVYPTEYTPTSINIFELTDRLVNVGNGTADLSRSDAFTILKNGTLIAPSLTPALITTAGNPSLITKEYGDANYLGATPLTTKGDILSYTTVNARLGVGTNGQVLTADSGEAIGVKWATVAGSGDVIKVGTPVNDQVGVWTGDGTIEGTSGLTYNGTAFGVTGNITATGTIDGIDVATDVAANTAKVTNATHTGDVTGATALTIAVDAVDIAMLSATGTPSGTTYLRGDNTWATPAGGGGGDVTKVGTPVNSQIGVWTGDGTIEGDSAFTYNGTKINLEETGANSLITFNRTDGMTMALKAGTSVSHLIYDEAGVFRFSRNDKASILNGTGTDISLELDGNGLMGVGISPLTGARMTVEGAIKLDEIASAGTNTGGYGKLWVRNDVPNVLMFTNDISEDFEVAGSDFGTKHFTIEMFDGSQVVTTGDGNKAVTIPSYMSGYDLVNVVASVEDKGVTGTTNVIVRRWRAGTPVNMTSTPVTIGDEWFATDEVINVANDDVITGDRIYIDVDAIHSGTAPNGLSIVLEFRKP